MSILNDVRLNIGDDDGTAASGTFGSSSFVTVSGSANLLGDIRVNIGDDSETGGGGQLAGSHYLLSSTHLDTVPGTPTSPSVIVSLSGTNLWAILPGTIDGTVLSYTSGSIQFIPIAGVSGVQGPAGPAGPSGAPGPSGETGPQGPTGPSGAQGIQGIQGPSGVAGPSGATGAQGPQGDVGPSGATGPSGLPGQDGATGPQGPPGPIVGWSGVLSVNNWSGPYSPVVQNKLYGLDDIHIASGNQLIWAVNASGNEVVGVLASGSGFIKITDGRDGVGHIIFNSRMPSVWDPLPYDITQALDWLAIATGIPGPSGATGPQGPQGPSGVAGPSGATGADGATGATGPQGPPGPIVGWSGVLNVNNWSGPHDVIIEQPARLFDDLIIASGQPILWSNTSNPSGGFQVGILPSGSGVIKITDGYSGQGYIFYSPSVPTNWSAPAPATIESALDALVKATGILAGGTGNPPVITEGLAETTSAGNWSSITDIVTLGRTVVSGNILLPSSGLFVWSSNVDPSGTPKVLIYSPGAGLVQVSGHIVYVPSTPGDWNTGVPSTITQALDFLAAATGQGGGSQPQTLNQVLSRGNWSGPIPIVSEHAIYSQSGVFVASGVQIKWSNILSPSGGPQLGIVSSGSGMLKITDGNVGNGHLLFFSRNPGLWGNLPADVTSALDMLAANSGDIVGLTNISGLSEVLTRGNWGGTTPIVTEASVHISGSPIVSSGQQILWSNRAIPSGGYQLGIMASGSGILKVTDGWSGYGKIYYSPGNVNDWSAPSPVTIESALDALVKATGILAGGTGNPPRIIDGLSETTNAGNWSSVTSVVTLGNAITSGNLLVPTSGLITWSSTTNPSGSPKVLIYSPDVDLVQISGHLVYVPTTSADWTQIPTTVTNALDQLAKATGVLAGNSGNPIQPAEALNQTLVAGNWSGPVPIVAQHAVYANSGLYIPSGVPIEWSNVASASGDPQVGIIPSGSGFIKITDGHAGNGHLLFFSRNQGLWPVLPTDVTQALDLLAANSGDIVGLTNISGLSEVLTRGNWGGLLPIVTEASIHISGSPIIGSGQAILWSNRAIPSGGYQAGILPSGSGFLKITDGSNGLGHIIYSPSNPNDWSAPIPNNIDSALDALVKATGILAGGTGNPPHIIDGISETLIAGNWGGLTPFVLESNTHVSGNNIVGSGSSILWTNRAQPSGGYQLGLVASGSGILRVTDGWSGDGYIFYSPTTPGDWDTGIPATIERALDLLAAATGQGGGGGPSTDGLSEVLTRGEWSGPRRIVAQSGMLSSNEIVLISGVQLKFTNTIDSGSLRSVGLDIHSPGILKVTNADSNLGSLLVNSNSLYLGTTLPTGISISAPVNVIMTVRAADGNPAHISVPGSGINSEQFGYRANAVGQTALAVGNFALASGLNSISIGNANIASASGSIAIGTKVNSGGQGTIIIGSDSLSSSDGNVVIGTGNNIFAVVRNVTIGPNNRGANSGITIGCDNKPGNTIESISIGNDIKLGTSSSTNRISIGNRVWSDTGDSYRKIIAIGDNVIISGTNVDFTLITDQIAIGHDAKIIGLNGVGITNIGNVLVGDRTYSSVCTNASIYGTDASAYSTTRTSQIGFGSEMRGGVDTIIGGSYIISSGTFSVCFGSNANAGFNSGVVIGAMARDFGQRATVVGYRAFGFTDSISIGPKAYSKSYGSISIGMDNQASGNFSICVGSGALASGSNSVVIGPRAFSTQSDSVVIGEEAYSTSNPVPLAGPNSTGNYSVIIGYRAKSYEGNSIAIGKNATIDIPAFTDSVGSGSIAIGDGARAIRNDVAIGTFATSSGSTTDNVVIGNYATTASGGGLTFPTSHSVIIGSNALASAEVGGGTAPVIIGYKATSHNGASVCIGGHATTGRTSISGISIGYLSRVSEAGAIAIGPNSKASTVRSIAIGQDASAQRYEGIAIGHLSFVGTTASSGIAIGSLATTSGNNSICIGSNALVGSNNSISIGANSKTNISPAETGSIAIGFGASAAGNSTSFSNIAIGDHAIASSGVSVSVANTIVIGNYADSRLGGAGASIDAVVIGNHAKISSGAGNLEGNIVIGCRATANTTRNAVIIGNGASHGATWSSGIVIGAFANSNNAGVSIGADTHAVGAYSTVIGLNASTTSVAERAIAVGYQALVTHIDAGAFGYRATSIGSRIYTFGSDAIGISLHTPSGYLRIGHLHGTAALASGDIWAGGHNQPWLWYNQDSGSLRVADNQGNGIIELNAIQQRVIVSGDIVYTGTRIAGTDVFTTSATVRREFSIFRHGASVWPVASLPSAPQSGVVHTIKDGAGLAATNNIMVSGVGKTIDGQNGIPIVNNYGSLTVVYNGTEWSVT